jgi:hypothetical protein
LKDGFPDIPTFEGKEKVMVNRIWFLPVLLGLVGGAAPAAAADLAQIDRTIRKEPTYQTKPKYCLLVFGPEAKTRVWLVQDGDVLYVDRNANGDLTEKGKRVEGKADGRGLSSFQAGDIQDGALTHKDLSITQFPATPQFIGDAREFERVKKANAEPRVWWIRVSAERPADDARPLPKHIKYVINGDGLGNLLFANRPQEAPIVHLNGPWTLGLQDIKQHLVVGQKTNLQLGVGTQGVGPGTFSFVLYPNTIPEKVYPEAVVTFPGRDASAKPLTEKVTFTKRC